MTLTATIGGGASTEGNQRRRSDSKDDDCQHDYYSPSTQRLSSPTSPHQRRTGKCPLHPLIRQRKWSEVARVMKQNPSRYVLQQNSQGWSSMTLCLYHSAPLQVISEMISLLNVNDQRTLLSSRIPNGSRVCLHFAARYATDVETIQVLTEAFPPALLMASDDGILPVDRAIYYRKDAPMLHYLEQRTKQQRNVQLLKQFNTSLRYTVILACEHFHCQQQQQQQQQQDNPHGPMVLQHSKKSFSADRSATSTGPPKTVKLGGHEAYYNDEQQQQQEQDLWLVKELYNYCKERELKGMFWNVLSFVGVQSIG